MKMRKIFEELARQRSDRDHGLWYAGRYASANNVSIGEALALKQPNYFYAPANGVLVARPGVPPDVALAQFFHGPTTTECGALMQAAVYKALLKMVGKERFNREFSAPNGELRLSPVFFDSRRTDPVTGNPLQELFMQVSRSDVAPGDICYVGGVSSYEDKHPIGSGSGEHAVCVGRNQRGENIFDGFGLAYPVTLQEFDGSLTYIYNMPPSRMDLDRLNWLSSQGDPALRERGMRGLNLRNHTVGYGTTTGIEFAFRINPRAVRERFG
jgi:hypothetical protein